jgi:hypothetical protein
LYPAAGEKEYKTKCEHVCIADDCHHGKMWYFFKSCL